MAILSLEHRNNSELIANIAEIGYLQQDVATCDPTYGLGNFWNDWVPDEACQWFSDLAVEKSPQGYSIDFEHTPYLDGFFPQVIFDPPFKLSGKPGGTMDDNYGIDKYIDWRKRHAWIKRGITEMTRILDPTEGVLIVKCMDQVCASRYRWQAREFAEHAESLGLRLVDTAHVQSYRPQPGNRPQVHFHRGYSTALILTSHRRKW